jgi:glycosyltransferase involved in cell wall biosynthesis
MATEIPASVAVRRIATPEPPWSSGSRRRAERWLRLTSAWQRWWQEGAVPLAVSEGAKADVDVVYASVAPFETAPAAAAIARKLGKPLVVDLEDPWVLDEMMMYETAVHRRLELRRMRRALEAADGIVMNTPEAAARVRETFPTLAETPMVSIVNGFDAADFSERATPRNDDVLRIVHTGTLHTSVAPGRSLARRLLGGAYGDVNVRTRSIVYLMAALDDIIREQPGLRDRIEVHLAGRLTPSDREVIGDSPLVRAHGFLNHAGTLALMRSADVLFLPMHDLPAGRRVAIVPCKTYEYLGAERPILAAVPDGDARDFLSEAGNAWICRPTDVAGIKEGLLDALARRAAGTQPQPASPELLERLERRALTRDLSTFLERLTPDSRGGRSRRPVAGVSGGR